MKEMKKKEKNSDSSGKELFAEESIWALSHKGDVKIVFKKSAIKLHHSQKQIRQWNKQILPEEERDEKKS